MTLIIVLIISLVLAAADQLIKYFIYAGLYPEGSIEVIPGLFTLQYVENRGAAFGIFQNGTLILSIVSVLFIALFVYFVAAKKLSGKLFLTSAVLVIGGAVGNLIDRIFRGFVIDYLAVSFFPPVCNFADYCITVGAALLLISVIFSLKDEPEAGEGAKEIPEESSEDQEADDGI